MNSRRLPSQHKRIRWAIAILAIGATGCPTDDSKRVAETAAVATKPVVVKTVRVQQGSQRRTSLQPATVHALFESKIRTMVTGYVEDIRVDIGDVVQPGDTLIKISVPEKIKQRDVMAAQVDRKRAEQMRVTAGITLAEAKVEAAEANLEEARSQLQSVEASLAAAQAEYDRTQDLVERGSLQRRVLDEVTQKRDSQVAAKNAVQSS
ncbi:MAG: biotin/lipoyl-binding protein, partial [Planctomycetota bacterium]